VNNSVRYTGFAAASVRISRASHQLAVSKPKTVTGIGQLQRQYPGHGQRTLTAWGHPFPRITPLSNFFSPSTIPGTPRCRACHPPSTANRPPLEALIAFADIIHDFTRA
jgi:hypothetical protein